MERRDFLKLAAISGLSVAGPLRFLNLAHAGEADTYTGPLWVMIHAGGGWDPTSLCDPKGRLNEEEESPVNMFFKDDIGQIGNIRYAPVEGHQAFFEKYYSQLLIINGLDTSTNGHDSGTRNVWSGSLREGHPSFAALVAGVYAPQKPMAFISSGGYDYTSDLVAPTRVGDTNVLAELAYPDRIAADDEVRRFHTEATVERIAQARAARFERQQQVQQLPNLSHSMNMLHTARVGGNELKKLTEYLPPLDNTGNALKRQAQVAVAAYKAGIAISANLSIGGFDTHGNHDANQFPRLQLLLEGVDFLMEEAGRQGVADQIVVMVSSDFGRTPGYNAGNGKDHWSITSAMLMGQGIVGNRVIGITDDYHTPFYVDPNTFEPSETGIRVTPAHLHRALRRHAGIWETETSQRFPLNVEDLALLD